MFSNINKTNTQLVAQCLFCRGEVQYENYDKYYKEDRIKDIIEAENDY